MRGFSIGLHPFPAIAINGKDIVQAKLFTLVHELVHVLLGASALCDLEIDFNQNSTSTGRIEKYCNAVAAATTMPAEAVLNEELVAGATPRTIWGDKDLFHLAGRFGVSAEAMLLRLVTLNRTSWYFYLQRRSSVQRRYSETHGGKSSFGNYYRQKVRDLGRGYITAVINAHRRDAITTTDLLRYLDIKLKNLPSLYESLESRA